MEDEQQRKEKAQQRFVEILKEDNEELRNQNRDLRKLLKQKRVAWDTKKSKPEEEDKSDPMVTQSTMMNFIIQYGGLSRWAIADDAWHVMHPTAANQLFGFKDWTDAKR
jgi:hypothetical protein